MTISPLLRLLGISTASPELKPYEMARGKLLAETAALAELEQLRSQGLITDTCWMFKPAPSAFRPSSRRNTGAITPKLKGGKNETITQCIPDRGVDPAKLRYRRAIHAGVSPATAGGYAATSELAGVIAHEISHVTARHADRLIMKQISRFLHQCESF